MLKNEGGDYIFEILNEAFSIGEVCRNILTLGPVCAQLYYVYSLVELRRRATDIEIDSILALQCIVNLA